MEKDCTLIAAIRAERYPKAMPMKFIYGEKRGKRMRLIQILRNAIDENGAQSMPLEIRRKIVKRAKRAARNGINPARVIYANVKGNYVSDSRKSRFD